MSGKRFGLGPHEIRDGAILKFTETDPPRQRCFMDVCYTTPKHIVTYYDRQIWVCKRHTDVDGIGNSS